MKNRLQLSLLVLGLATCGVSAQALDHKTIAARTDRLRQMSELERGRFDRNLQEFEKLSDAEKQKYRQLHRDLADDTARAGGLSKLLETYSLWVQTLTPTQRDELRKETVLSQRIALIRRFKEEQDEPADANDVQQGGTPVDDIPPPVNVTINKREALAQKDLKNVMAVLVNHLSQQTMNPEFNERRLVDFIPILHASVQTYGGSYTEWPTEPLLKEMTASLTKESTAQVSRSDYKSRREAMIRYLLMGILKQARDAVPIPTESEKSQIWESLGSAERERVANFPLERMNGYLIRKSMELKGGDVLRDFKKLPEYIRQVEELFKLFEVTPPAKLQQRVKKPEAKRTPASRPNRSNEDK